jgi:ABC-type uncharacterized transport system substrate-binding protein
MSSSSIVLLTARSNDYLALAAELLGVDIIVTGANSNTVAAMKATTTIPIVMTNSADPVNDGVGSKN